MKYHYLFRHLPQDIRPMGVNNLNQLVHHHLGNESFDVVLELRNNLSWLYALHEKLPLITVLANSTHEIDEVAKHMRLIREIGYYIPQLRDIHKNLNKLVEEGKDIKDLNKNISNLSTLVQKIELHNQANDAVFLATETKKLEDINSANELIQKSIRAGNNESINILKLGKIENE